jgi:hypothetical protein
MHPAVLDGVAGGRSFARTGSEEYIILSITETSYSPYLEPPDLWPPRYENSRPSLLMNLQLSDLADSTFLSTGGNQKVRIVKYDPPSYDGLGAKFFFPRRFSSGKEWVTPHDKNLRFTTRLRGKVITAKFDLRKLKLNGRLEI